MEKVVSSANIAEDAKAANAEAHATNTANTEAHATATAAYEVEAAKYKSKNKR
jgi:hypothetical protein